MMEDMKTSEDIIFSKRFIEYYEQKGFDVGSFKRRREYREILISVINYN